MLCVRRCLTFSVSLGTTNKIFSLRDVLCGQLQCEDNSRKKPVVDYGQVYTKVELYRGSKKKCRLELFSFCSSEKKGVNMKNAYRKLANEDEFLNIRLVGLDFIFVLTLRNVFLCINPY